MSAKWELLDKRIVYKHPRHTVAENRIRLPGGQEIEYLTFEDVLDFPTIIAVDDLGRIAVLLEHTYPENDAILQFPEGVGKPGEPTVEIAARELTEETGKIATRIVEIGGNLHNHRRSTARNRVYLATGLVDGSKHPDDEEDIAVNWMTEADIWQAIASGEIIQKNTLAAWAIYQASRQIISENE